MWPWPLTLTVDLDHWPPSQLFIAVGEGMRPMCCSPAPTRPILIFHSSFFPANCDSTPLKSVDLDLSTDLFNLDLFCQRSRLMSTLCYSSSHCFQSCMNQDFGKIMFSFTLQKNENCNFEKQEHTFSTLVSWTFSGLFIKNAVIYLTQNLPGLSLILSHYYHTLLVDVSDSVLCSTVVSSFFHHLFHILFFMSVLSFLVYYR